MSLKSVPSFASCEGAVEKVVDAITSIYSRKHTNLSYQDIHRLAGVAWEGR